MEVVNLYITKNPIARIYLGKMSELLDVKQKNVGRGLGAAKNKSQGNQKGNLFLV